MSRPIKPTVVTCHIFVDHFYQHYLIIPLVVCHVFCIVIGLGLLQSLLQLKTKREMFKSDTQNVILHIIHHVCKIESFHMVYIKTIYNAILKFCKMTRQ